MAQQDANTNIKPIEEFCVCGECLAAILNQKSELKTFIKHKIPFVFFDNDGDESEPFVFEYKSVSGV
jgi:hypothetical protein